MSCSLISFCEHHEFCSFESFYEHREFCSFESFCEYRELCLSESLYERRELCFILYSYLRVALNTSSEIVTIDIIETLCNDRVQKNCLTNNVFNKRCC